MTDRIADTSNSFSIKNESSSQSLALTHLHRHGSVRGRRYAHLILLRYLALVRRVTRDFTAVHQTHSNNMYFDGNIWLIKQRLPSSKSCIHNTLLNWNMASWIKIKIHPVPLHVIIRWILHQVHKWCGWHAGMQWAGSHNRKATECNRTKTMCPGPSYRTGDQPPTSTRANRCTLVRWGEAHIAYGGASFKEKSLQKRSADVLSWASTGAWNK